MSNVLKRHRSISDYEFYKKAIAIRTEVISLVNNEKYVPKRRRMVVGNRALNHAMDVVEYITKANSSFPSSPEILFIRKWYQLKAIAECEALVESLRVILELNNNGKTNRIMSIVYLVIDEIDLLKRWMNNTKLQSHSSKYLAKNTNNVNAQTIVVSNAGSAVPSTSSVGVTPVNAVGGGNSNNSNNSNNSGATMNNSSTQTDTSLNNLLVMLLVLLEDTSKFKNLI